MRHIVSAKWSSSEDVTAAAHLDWSYEENSWPHVSDSGSADVAVSKTEVST